MRKRIAAAMMAVVLAVFPVSMLLMTQRSFTLTMARERERALSEEAAIARAIAMEISGGSYKTLLQTAQNAQQRYGSASLTVALLYFGAPMAGAALPPEAEPLLQSEAKRATLLDGGVRRLFLAHRLTGSVTLLLSSDVSPVYALRERLLGVAAALCAAGLALAGAAAWLLSGVAMRPVRALSHAADALSGGDYGAALPPAGRDEIGALTRSFGAMAQAVRQREEALREHSERQQLLIDAMAHEMRTPLTAIVAGGRLLQSAALPPEKQDALLSTLVREAQRLADMDERLLTLTRLRSEPLAAAPYDLADMAREALAVFENVELSAERSGTLTGDRELMIELMRNLIVNAQRAGGSAPVRVTLHPDGFSVTDKGRGMTAEEAARACEPFYKADRSRTRAAGGAGLGLTLCRRIASLHGGTLTIDSAVGRGTTVAYRQAEN